MFARLREDIRTVFDKDPAARSTLEVLLCYPGLHAIWYHRVSHWFWTHGCKLAGRMVSHLARRRTGIEIHPGATIGRRFFIDHGMGVVIGETAEIGEDVLLYHGVTLGGTSLQKKKRHPTIGNNVVIGTGAAILGPFLVGEGAKIGAGSVVVKEVPPGATVVGIPGKIVEEGVPRPKIDLDHAALPDPVAEAIGKVLGSQEHLQACFLQMQDNMTNMARVVGAHTGTEVGQTTEDLE
ncbi:MAG: serine O-acetyltransferase [Armatimonadota bacterium]